MRAIMIYIQKNDNAIYPNLCCLLPMRHLDLLWGLSNLKSELGQVRKAANWSNHFQYI